MAPTKAQRRTAKRRYSRDARKEARAAKAQAKHDAQIKKRAKSMKTSDVTSMSPIAPLFERWKKGEQLFALVQEAGVKRSKFRRQLIQLAGGKAAFRELRAKGAGGTAEPFGGKRGAGRTRESIALDDSKATQLKSSDVRYVLAAAIVENAKARLADVVERLKRLDAKTPVAHAAALQTERAHCEQLLARAKADAKHPGWRAELYATSTGTAVRLVAPDGKRYVAAGPTERADVVTTSGVDRSRFKLESEAAAAKRQKKEKELIERGEALIKQTRARKRAAKQRRKAGRSK